MIITGALACAVVAFCALIVTACLVGCWAIVKNAKEWLR